MARRILQISLVLLLTFALSGCLFRSRTVNRRISDTPVKSATAEELIAKINSEAAAVQSLNLTVDLTTSIGGAKRGKITEYKEIRGYVLVRKPEMLRLVGLMPVVRTKAFDMVSQGDTFKLHVVPTNKFYVGPREVVYPSKNQLENLRPQIFYDSLLLSEIDPKEQIAVLENTSYVLRDDTTKKEIEQPTYTLLVMSRGKSGWYLSRKIVFSRIDLEPQSQLIYDEKGVLITDALFEKLQDVNGVKIPWIVNIRRPVEEYMMRLEVVKARVNEPIKDEQFAMPQPNGAQLVRLDIPPDQRPDAKKQGERKGGQ